MIVGGYSNLSRTLEGKSWNITGSAEYDGDEYYLIRIISSGNSYIICKNEYDTGNDNYIKRYSYLPGDYTTAGSSSKVSVKSINCIILINMYNNRRWRTSTEIANEIEIQPITVARKLRHLECIESIVKNGHTKYYRMS